MTANQPDSAKLGTLGGVFTPSLLTILGLVLFLRLGFVVGNVGLIQMLAILGLATAVSVLTTISLAAIATNLKVGGGGVYFLISRTLGAAFGGSIGLVLYLAMSVSVAFYTIGLGEAITSITGSSSTVMPRLIAAGTIVALTALAWVGADVATRLQYLVMVCLVVAIGAYFVGAVPDMSSNLLTDNLGAPSGGIGFWVSFAIFFPAITGFTQGVAMSGDLRTPSRSITIGTFAAIGLSTVVYLAVVFSFAAAVPLAELRADTAIMRRLAPAAWLIDVGVIAATLSSAIASILGAPRTLQRLAADRLVPVLQPFAEGAGPSNNPRRGVLLSAGIAMVTVAAGDLDVVAPIISMFFLASYGMINYATYSEARAASTSFRPSFRYFHWRLSLLGTFGCVGAILAIDPLAGAVAGMAVFGIYRYLARSAPATRWADSTRSFHATEVRMHLLAMGPAVDPGRDWRPCTVAFASRDPQRRQRLSAVASWIEGGAGFTTIVRIVPGAGPMVRRHAARIELELQNELSPVGSYGRVVVADTVEQGVASVLQSHGIGPLRPNVSLFNWHSELGSEIGEADPYWTVLQTGLRNGTHLAVLAASDPAWNALNAAAGADRRILVWWSDDRNGQLLTMLAWLCTRTPSWNQASIEVVVCDDDPAEADRITDILEDARLPAVVSGIAGPTEFTHHAATAHLVFAPLRARTSEALGPGNIPIAELLDDLPITVFAQAVAPVDLDVQPDLSISAELAVATDRAQALTARAHDLDAEASRLLVDAELTRMDSDNDPARITEAEEKATQAHRDYLDVKSRADQAWRIAYELDPSKATAELSRDLWVSSEPETT